MPGREVIMSVPENQRGHGKLEACMKSRELAVYTIQISANKKIFAEEYQQALTDKIVGAALDITNLCWNANNVLVDTADDMENRLRLQEEAAIRCNTLLSLISIAHKVFHLSTKRVRYWSELTIEVRNRIRAWRTADRKRYSARFK